MFKEVDIAKPIENYLEDLGYRVRSEVKGCDITGIKDDNLVVVECKKSFSMKLLYQAIDRQEFCDNVYIAIPILQGKKILNKKHMLRLLKRLELGLITVTFLKTKTRVDVLLDPKQHKKRRRLKHRASIITEISERSGNYNVGGSVRTQLMTAYKESAMLIAELLKSHGPLTSVALRKLGSSKKTYTILYKNYYGWFYKESGRGLYGLSEKGLSFIKTLDRE